MRKDIRRRVTMRIGIAGRMALAFLFCIVVWCVPRNTDAHCDTLDGPVIISAKAAFEKNDVTPVLKWVRKADEAEIQGLFTKALAARKQGKEAKELADMYFFETLVRIHRAGEGAPYTGLKPAGTVEPSVAAADKALESGSADSLVKMVNDAAAQGIRERFAHALETKKHADESVESGRKFVAAYVEFTHYVERLHMDALRSSGHSVRNEAAGAEGHHHH
jgi:hypothetical protein